MPHFPGLPADRVEAVIFASREPIPREVLACVVGRGRNIDLLIAAIRDELRGRPYDLVAVAGGWQHRTRTAFAPAIRTATGCGEARPLSKHETLVLRRRPGGCAWDRAGGLPPPQTIDELVRAAPGGPPSQIIPHLRLRRQTLAEGSSIHTVLADG